MLLHGLTYQLQLWNILTYYRMKNNQLTTTTGGKTINYHHLEKKDFSFSFLKINENYTWTITWHEHTIFIWHISHLPIYFTSYYLSTTNSLLFFLFFFKLKLVSNLRKRMQKDLLHGLKLKISNFNSVFSWCLRKNILVTSWHMQSKWHP